MRASVNGSPVRDVNLVNVDQANAAAAGQVANTVGFAVNNLVEKPTSKSRKLSVEELVQERLKTQPELLRSYPDMPVIDHAKVSTFTDYAYAAHDQAGFLCKAMAEIRSMHESHFMTKKNKELMKEKKRLEEELALSKSMGPSDSGEYDLMRSQL